MINQITNRKIQMWKNKKCRKFTKINTNRKRISTNKGLTTSWRKTTIVILLILRCRKISRALTSRFITKISTTKEHLMNIKTKITARISTCRRWLTTKPNSSSKCIKSSSGYSNSSIWRESKRKIMLRG